MDKGDFAMDDWDSVEEHLKEFDVWYEIWKNVRSNLMPPADKKQFTPEERREVLAFIESNVFKIDHENPDPGRVTISMWKTSCLRTIPVMASIQSVMF